MDRTETFFEDYRRAFEAGDVEAAADRYALPLMAIRIDRRVVVEDRATLLGYLQKVHDTYAWCDLHSVKLRYLEQSVFDPGLTIANVGWELSDWHGRQITTIDVTYVLDRAEDMRIVTIIAHNEEQRRLPLVEEEAPPDIYATPPLERGDGR